MSPSRHLALDACDELMRHGAGADPADGAIAAMIELRGDDLGLILVSVGDRCEGRREQLLADAAMPLVMAVKLATPPFPPMSTVIIRSDAGKITLRGI